MKFTDEQYDEIGEAIEAVVDASNAREVTDAVVDWLRDNGSELTFQSLKRLSAEQVAALDPADVDRVLAAGPDGSPSVDDDARLDHQTSEALQSGRSGAPRTSGPLTIDAIREMSADEIEARWPEVERVIGGGQ